MNFLKILIFLSGLVAALPFSASAQDKTDESKASEMKLPVEMTEGEIRKVDKEFKKITIKHGEIKHLDMPAMTMVFQIKDPAVLDQIKAGDKVKFLVEKTGGAFVITEIQRTQ